VGWHDLDEHPRDLWDGTVRLKVLGHRYTDGERFLLPLPWMIVRNRCVWGLGVCAPG
jgi:hypothetical protein